MTVTTIGWLAALVLGFGLVSSRLERWWVTVPIGFTTLGVLLGPAGAGLVDVELEREGLRVLAEATLLLILFTDAVRIDLRALRLEYALPVRLLGLGFPLAVALGAVAAWVMLPGLGWAAAFLIAAILAPTDAALGQAVVDDRRVPERIRQGLNVESGLNDGLALPLVTALVALVAAESEGGAASWFSLAARQIGFGTIVGGIVGGVSAVALDRAAARNWVSGVFRQLATFAVPVLALALAHPLDGNGFIAAFVAGLVFGHVAPERCDGVTDFASDEGFLLEIVVFFAFGANLLGPRLGELTLAVVAYAAASLALVRPVAVALGLVGGRLRPGSVGFVGWFGPRGLASILFALLLVEEGMRGAPELDVVELVVFATVGLSVLAHGLSAQPLTDRYVAYLDRVGMASEDRSTPWSPSRRAGARD